MYSVLQVPVAPLQSPDSVTWMPNFDGIFAAKRGYWLAKQLTMLKADGPQVSNLFDEQQLHKAIWNPKLHPRVSVWVWHAVKNKLPTRLNLFKRGIIDNPICSFYFQKEENLIHCIHLSPRAWDAWKSWNPRFTMCTTISNVKFRWLSVLQQEDIIAFCMEITIAWGIWRSRNSIIFKQVAYSPSLILQNSLSYMPTSAVSHGVSASTQSLAQLVHEVNIHSLAEHNILVCINGAFKNGLGTYGGYILGHNEILLSCLGCLGPTIHHSMD